MKVDLTTCLVCGQKPVAIVDEIFDYENQLAIAFFHRTPATIQVDGREIESSLIWPPCEKTLIGNFSDNEIDYGGACHERFSVTLIPPGFAERHKWRE